MKLTTDLIRRRFQERGLKSTPQRTAIYKALAERTNHPSPEDLYRQVSRIHPMLSPNTVYYTLAVLQDVGLVREVHAGHHRARFDANLSPHHHLICLGCEAIIDLTDETLNHLSPRTGVPGDFEVLGHQVEFRGYCGHCRRNACRMRRMPSRKHLVVHPLSH